MFTKLHCLNKYRKLLLKKSGRLRNWNVGNGMIKERLDMTKTAAKKL